jgi:predicted nucleotidyltransferase
VSELTQETVFSQLIEPKLDELAALCRHLGVQRLELFGSAVTGRFDPARSDLDFLVEFGPSPLGGRYAKACFELQVGLERLFCRSVDLLTTVPDNPYLRHQINAEVRRVYPPS